MVRRNVGRLDAAIRTVGGLALVGLLLLGASRAETWATVTLGTAAVIGLASGLSRFCLAYWLLGISTVTPERHQQTQ